MNFFCIFLPLDCNNQKYTKFSLVANVVLTYNMAKLIIVQRNWADDVLQTSMSSRAVARAFNLCHSTILRLRTIF